MRRRLIYPLSIISFAFFTFVFGLFSAFGQSSPADESLIDVRFSFDVDRNAYGSTVYRSPPQWVVWIESPDGAVVRTLWATQCTAQSTWRGKTSCPVALPYWTSRFNHSTGTEGPPTLENPLPDAVSRPTPKVEPKGRTFPPDSPDRWDRVRETVELPAGSEWNCFLEINVSGDYNDAFLKETSDGTQDVPGNGQPAIVYKGRFTVGDPSSVKQPEIIGRSDQFDPEKSLRSAGDEITTARELAANFRVTWESDDEE